MKQETLQLTGGNNNGDRRALDHYPTPKNVTIALMDFLKLRKDTVIWEPACGKGQMVEVLKSYCTTVIGTDIIYGDDYLTTFKESDAIITNPPFNLSEQFIEKAVNETGLVALLLKSQYWHASKRTALFNKYRPKYVLPLNWRPDFLEHERLNGGKGAPTMEVAWTVWEKNNNQDTIYKILSKPLNP